MRQTQKFKIPFNKPCIEGGEIDNVLDSIATGKIAGDGKYNKLCHEEIAAAISAKRVLLTTSGTDALELCSLLYDIGLGDEVIMPSYTFVSTANAFCMRGAVPVFVDIRADTFNMDETLIEAAITDKTKAIVPVHYAGVACEMDAINRIAKKHGLIVIEDAAQGFMATYRGKHLGTLGDAGCFSFHETKTFMCGEGGAVVLNNNDDIEKAEIIRDKGTNRNQFFKGAVDKYTWTGVGSSFLPSDIMGSILYGQWLARERILAKRKKIYSNYLSRFSHLVEKGLMELPRIPEHCETNYHMFAFLVRNVSLRDRLISYLGEKGVCAVFHYMPLHTSPYAAKLGINVSLPITEDVSSRVIRMPFFNDLESSDQEYIEECVESFLLES